ncbi:TIGR02449 family protein [Marinicella rhabdoformis]|uniref:TIGR02449 family protein n=1 Tax=Marinicella rhabdoformis TaxID=2580566 RepID=UPI0012AEC869|nr:TIGR02449 family protein [Marinicella rhabdoformis]
MKDIELLEASVSQLIEAFQKCQTENNLLKEKLLTINTEKSQLLLKNDQAKNRLESMISRLKTLEQSA